MTTSPRNPYTVVLVFPDDAWDEVMAENVFLVHIDAEGLHEAVKRAQLKAADDAGPDFRPSDFTVVAVFEGKCESLVPVGFAAL